MDAHWANLAILVSINAIAALGLYMTLLSNQLSMAHAALFGLAGYTSGVLAIYLKWPLPLTVLTAVALSTFAGAALSVAATRVRGFYMAILTLAFAEVMVVVFQNATPIGGADGLSGIPTFTGLPVAAVSAAAVVFGVRRWERYRAGLVTRAVGEDETAAACIGINLRWVKLLSFALGGLLVGYAGALYAHYIGLVTPTDMGFQAMIVLVFYVGLGGMSTYGGAVAGAVIITLLPEVLRLSIYDRYLIFGLVLAAMMLVRPHGLVRRRPLGSPAWYSLGRRAASRLPREQSTNPAFPTTPS